MPNQLLTSFFHSTFEIFKPWKSKQPQPALKIRVLDTKLSLRAFTMSLEGDAQFSFGNAHCDRGGRGGAGLKGKSPSHVNSGLACPALIRQHLSCQRIAQLSHRGSHVKPSASPQWEKNTPYGD